MEMKKKKRKRTKGIQVYNNTRDFFVEVIKKHFDNLRYNEFIILLLAPYIKDITFPHVKADIEDQFKKISKNNKNLLKEKIQEYYKNE